MELRILYIADCPNREIAVQRLRDALTLAGRSGLVVHEQEVLSEAHATQLDFRGSPTIVVNGRDPFTDPHGSIGMSCRRYETPDGVDGAPSVEQLVIALAATSG